MIITILNMHYEPSILPRKFLRKGLLECYLKVIVRVVVVLETMPQNIIRPEFVNICIRRIGLQVLVELLAALPVHILHVFRLINGSAVN